MAKFRTEPALRVGLITSVPAIRFELFGTYATPDGMSFPEGAYRAQWESACVRLEGPASIITECLVLKPANAGSRFTVHDVTIGIDFHWQQQESQTFEGALQIAAGTNGLSLINELAIESYLASVISSEMSASCPPELLRAHAVVSRSWLLAQLTGASGPSMPEQSTSSPSEIIRWYGREAHDSFDVCSDDHCQRYQGIGKAFSASASDSVAATRGRALVSGGEICDTRYSKCCGGMTEVFSTAWDDRELPYLVSVYDGAGNPPAPL
ncbi:MAG TPA: SpoIID/LytB domain-containing protein, partial [Blastocatellia bacterium]|nr:SpoIID/LytB domain-containing protein [Blastocatellia bacterium]